MAWTPRVRLTMPVAPRGHWRTPLLSTTRSPSTITDDPSSEIVASAYGPSRITRNQPDQVVLNCAGGAPPQASIKRFFDGCASRVITAACPDHVVLGK